MLSSDAYPAYSYLLGLYLGDGDITSHARGVFRLRVTLDSRYPGIVSCASRAMNEVLPRNRVGVHGRTRSNATAVTCYSKSWPKLLPQHGPGCQASAHNHALPMAETYHQFVPAGARATYSVSGIRVRRRSSSRSRNALPLSSSIRS
jgi:hypothetical protein